MATLTELDTHRTHALGASTTIGRSTECQVQIDDPMVSAKHAEIVRIAENLFAVRDLSSRRGTFVGARKIVTEQKLNDGDELLIGPIRFRFEASRVVETVQSDTELVRLRAVVELGRAIGVEHDLERLLSRVLDTCFQLLNADRGALVIYQPGSKAPFMTVTRGRYGEHTFPVSASVLGEVMLTHEPYLRTEIEHDAVLRRSESLTAQGVRSVIAVPVRYEAQEPEWLGVILLDSSALANVFLPRDLDLLTAIAAPTALAIKNAMLVRQVRTVIDEEWRRLERVVRDLPIGVIVLDDRQRCVLVNQWVRARDIEFGIEPGAIVTDIAGVSCAGLLDGDESRHLTTTLDRLLTVTASTLGGGREIVIVIHDITEERERQNQAAHRDRVALIGQLAGGVAHDFNNLLHVILTYAQLLDEGLPSDADLRDDAAQIIHAATSAAELTRQLLTFSRRELVKPKVVDVTTIVRNIEKLLLRTLGPDVELTVTIAAPIPRILMDSAQLEQVLMNLVVNARDAMSGRGHVTLTVDAVEHAQAVGALPAGQYVTIEVSDTGSGMPPEIVSRIFEPYFTTKARGKGTGLGLATVHGIIQQAKGDIVVDSVLGMGTTFRIALPATDQPTEEPRVTTTPPITHTATILVVDDDDDVRRVTERILKNAGYHVLGANSGPAAITIATDPATSIDLLLSDVVMPGMSGRDLARQLEPSRPNLRIVFMSGYHQHAPMVNSQFLAKPFGRVALLDKVRDALQSTAGAQAS
jgi:signal transduction histidine kinase/ActR/RegA family two-component response regulator